MGNNGAIYITRAKGRGAANEHYCILIARAPTAHDGISCRNPDVNQARDVIIMRALELRWGGAAAGMNEGDGQVAAA